MIPEIEETTMTDELVIHIDGASRGNPGPASVGVEIKDREHGVIKTVSHAIGTATNNVAEYSALLVALEEALVLRAQSLEIYTDSQLLARQFSGEYKVKDPFIRVLFRHAKRLVPFFKSCKVHHVAREENKNADKLANEALDSLL